MAKINLNKRYNYSISTPYALKGTELNAIKTFRSYLLKNWISNKKGIKSFKKNIRQYLEPKQKERCAYCRQYLQSSGKGEHLDHIIAKSARPQWMFVSLNLIITCSGCNTPKNASRVLDYPFNRRTVNYPNLSIAFKIFNPY